MDKVYNVLTWKAQKARTDRVKCRNENILTWKAEQAGTDRVKCRNEEGLQYSHLKGRAGKN
jgi:hypothetical protein